MKALRKRLVSVEMFTTLTLDAWRSHSCSADFVLLPAQLSSHLRRRGRLVFHICIKTERSLTKQTACAHNPHKDTLFLAAKWIFFPLMSWLQLLPSLIAPPGPYYPRWLKSHMLAPTALWFLRPNCFYGSLSLCVRMFWLHVVATTFLRCFQSHKATDTQTNTMRGIFNTLHMFVRSLVWHLQEHGNLCDWKSRLWLWSRADSWLVQCSVWGLHVGPPHVPQSLVPSRNHINRFVS